MTWSTRTKMYWSWIVSCFPDPPAAICTFKVTKLETGPQFIGIIFLGLFEAPPAVKAFIVMLERSVSYQQSWFDCHELPSDRSVAREGCRETCCPGPYTNADTLRRSMELLLCSLHPNKSLVWTVWTRVPCMHSMHGECSWVLICLSMAQFWRTVCSQR